MIQKQAFISRMNDLIAGGKQEKEALGNAVFQQVKRSNFDISDELTKIKIFKALISDVRAVIKNPDDVALISKLQEHRNLLAGHITD